MRELPLLTAIAATHFVSRGRTDGASKRYVACPKGSRHIAVFQYFKISDDGLFVFPCR